MLKERGNIRRDNKEGEMEGVPPPIKWTLSTNDREGVYDGESENEKGESVQ